MRLGTFGSDIFKSAQGTKGKGVSPPRRREKDQDHLGPYPLHWEMG